ncbi:MAG: TIGR02186 family protein [Alphaproteobacteria bacterium]
MTGRLRQRLPFATAAGITLVAALAVGGLASAAGEPLEVDINARFIAVTAGFTGATVDLYGATDGAGDVIVVVRGPAQRITMRRKERVAGIWINAASADFADVPGYYHVAASRPPADIASPETLAASRIGVDRLPLVAAEALPSAEGREWREALIRAQQRAGLFPQQVGKVAFRGTRLFTTRLSLPANVPTGQYDVDVLLVENRHIIGHRRAQLEVRKTGFEAGIYSFAHDRPALYGLIAIIIALVAGWLAGLVFRRI